jgi:hypothetical protein
MVMTKIILFIGLWTLCTTTLLAQFKPVLGGTFGSTGFYEHLTQEDKNEFLGVLNKFNIDTLKYVVIRDIDDYFKHVKHDSIGGNIISSSYLRFNKKTNLSTRIRKKRGSPIEIPVLYIRYWKDPDDDYLNFLIMTKS